MIFHRPVSLKWGGGRSSLFKVKFHRPLVLKMKQLPRAILKENTKIKILNIKLLLYLLLPKTFITTVLATDRMKFKKTTLCSNLQEAITRNIYVTTPQQNKRVIFRHHCCYKALVKPENPSVQEEEPDTQGKIMCLYVMCALLGQRKHFSIWLLLNS